jgi:hypothetical protein
MMEIIKEGIFGLIVCAPKEAEDKEILDFCNGSVPCRTILGWCEVYRETGYGSSPITCADNSERTHFVVYC